MKRPTKAAYVYDAEDRQGPHVLLCEHCLEADGRERDGDWLVEGYGWRCACCGLSDMDDVDTVVWRKRDDSGRVVEVFDDEVRGYHIDDYPGPGEGNADIDGIWWEPEGAA